MKAFKKLVVFSLGLAVLGSLIVGTTVAKGQQTITVLAATDKPWIPSITKDFEKKTGIKVNLVLVGWNDLVTKIVASCAAKVGAYDAIESDPASMVPWVEAGYLAPLEDRISDEEKQDLGANLNMALFPDGHIYGMPWLIDSLHLVYNDEMLKKAGFAASPKTWDEFVEMSRILQATGIAKHAVIWNWVQHEGEFCNYMIFLWTHGGRLFKEEACRTPAFTEKEGIEALDFMRDMYYKYRIVDPGSFSSRPLECATTLSQGKTAFTIIWSCVYPVVNDPEKSLVVGKTRIGLIPAKKVGMTRTVDGSETFSIPKNAKNKEAAWEYIKFICSKEVEKKVLYQHNILPVWMSLFTDPEINKDIPMMRAFGEQRKFLSFRPKVAWYEEFSHIMQVAILQALTQEKSSQKALDDAAEAVKKLIKERVR